MDLSDVVIILCRPSEPGNVGAVCRVMKNMGLSRLRIVAPEPFDEDTLLARTVHAEDVWRGAVFFDTLEEAAADCSLVIGTTRRRGRGRKNVSMEPRALASWLKAHEHAPVAFVFGNERAGLNDDELNFCNAASHVPVSDSFPSLNLSHAVQIYAYELFLAFGHVAENPVKGEWVPLEYPAVAELTESITGTLAELGFYRKPGREAQTRFLRDLICRAGLTEREGRYLKDIFIKAARLGYNKT
ncbi:MAG: TrmJ/YjtD family RNA methyltransferase [Treponema sp.]|jgi:tRNA/rRNA methyltransferase/tRNA (cytidine32/uridine32-2'-O)-methyltransferase|nr:TrmJ/YjtD family RNA methyltransferase [Treponema sp.]